MQFGRCFLYLSNCFVINKGLQGAIFGEHFGSFKNDPKSIAICLGTLISHVGIIKTLKKPKMHYKTKKNNESPNLFAVFWALLDHQQLGAYSRTMLFHSTQSPDKYVPSPRTSQRHSRKTLSCRSDQLWGNTCRIMELSLECSPRQSPGGA